MLRGFSKEIVKVLRRQKSYALKHVSKVGTDSKHSSVNHALYHSR